MAFIRPLTWSSWSLVLLWLCLELVYLLQTFLQTFQIHLRCHLLRWQYPAVHEHYCPFYSLTPPQKITPFLSQTWPQRCRKFLLQRFLQISIWQTLKQFLKRSQNIFGWFSDNNLRLHWWCFSFSQFEWRRTQCVFFKGFKWIGVDERRFDGASFLGLESFGVRIGALFGEEAEREGVKQPREGKSILPVFERFSFFEKPEINFEIGEINIFINQKAIELDPLIFGFGGKQFHKLLNFSLKGMGDGFEWLISISELDIIEEGLFGFEEELVEEGGGTIGGEGSGDGFFRGTYRLDFLHNLLFIHS